jgi:hypothetical protein
MDMYETLTVLTLLVLVYSSMATAYGKRRQQAT